MVTRRNFLGLIAGGLAAPAIVRAESLMKIVVPKKEIIQVGRGMSSCITYYDEVSFHRGQPTAQGGSLDKAHMRRLNKMMTHNSVYGKFAPSPNGRIYIAQ